MGRRCYVLLRRRHHFLLRCRGDGPLRRLGDVPRRRRWVFHLRRNCDVATTSCCWGAEAIDNVIMTNSDITSK